VEDELILRKSLRRILEMAGYAVVEAASEKEALEAWKMARQEIAILLTDIVLMSGMDGYDLGMRLSAEKSDLKVIYSTGQLTPALAKELGLKEGVNLLRKLYDSKTLVAAVRNALKTS
jgi:two-component system cell cycle sensor histidine kinase/response regulator CckA